MTSAAPDFSELLKYSHDILKANKRFCLVKKKKDRPNKEKIVKKTFNCRDLQRLLLIHK